MGTEGWFIRNFEAEGRLLNN